MSYNNLDSEPETPRSLNLGLYDGVSSSPASPWDPCAELSQTHKKFVAWLRHGISAACH